MAQFNSRVISIVLGATTGLSVVSYDKDGARILLEEKIPWIIDGPLWEWPIQWLADTLDQITKNIVEPGDIVVSGMWGADLLFCLRMGGTTYPLPHYRSVTEADLENALAKVGRTREEMYLLSGGAAAAFYQPLGILAATERLCPELLSVSDILGVVPFSGLINWKLSGGIPGHDETMRQSMGLHASTAASIYAGANFGAIPGEMIGAGPILEDGAVMSGYKSSRVLATSHDSVLSRLVGLTECNWVFWTGSWLGTTVRIPDNVVPTSTTFKANINFEGLGPTRAAVTNTGMFGPMYKELIGHFDLSYCEASESAAEVVRLVEPLPLETILAPNLPAWVCTNFKDPSKGIAAYLRGVAVAMVHEADRVAETLQIPLICKVAITGGWAENAAFVKALEFSGLDVVVPRHASSSTHAGLAANGLYYCKEFDSVKEALNALPELVS
ncbi:MAG: hypothetical protein WC227_01320 [Patescibacteria group bacterium]|jgi:hypothetical protein